MFSNLTIKKKLYIIAVTPVVVATFIIFGFITTTNGVFAKLIKTTSDECLATTQLILNGDRDAYQALSALQSLNVAPASKKQSYIDDYNENIAQVFERLEKAETILKTDKETWLEHATNKDSKDIFNEFEKAKSDFKEWKNISDKIVLGQLPLSKQEEQFDTARDHLNIIGELIESGSKNIVSDLKKQKENMFILLASISISLMIALAIFSIKISQMIAERLSAVVSHIQKIADKNLSIDDLKIRVDDEIGELGKAINTMSYNLRTIIKQVNASVGNILSNTESVSQSANNTAQGAAQTAQSTQQLAQGSQEISTNIQTGAVTINNVNKSIQGISSQALEVAKLGNETEISANSGSEQVRMAVVKIDSIKSVAEDISVTIQELGSLSSEIETIVDLIKNIAGQTNLLALNAAIEAARAGEHGKGFAVVAEEVKKLAGHSAAATDKITEMIKEIQLKTNDAVEKMDKATNEVSEGVTVVNTAGEALETIINQVKYANVKIQTITKEIENVAENSEEVVKMIENISAITEETAASAEEISSITIEQNASMKEISESSTDLSVIAESLNKQIAVFRV